MNVVAIAMGAGNGKWRSNGVELTVGFFVVSSGQYVEKVFDNYLECKKFVEKLKRSLKCILISYPNFER